MNRIIKERDRVNTESIRSMFSPEFIPFYRSVQVQYNLTDKQVLIYGLFRFYRVNSINNFYFTDKQVAGAIGCNEETVQRAIIKLGEVGLVGIESKIKAGGSMVRFIKEVVVPVPEKDLSKVSGKRSEGNKAPKRAGLTTFGNKDIGSLKAFLIKNYPYTLQGVTDNRKLWNLMQVLTPRKGQTDDWMNQHWKENFKVFVALYLKETENKYLVRSVDNLKEKAKLWREYRGKLS